MIPHPLPEPKCDFAEENITILNSTWIGCRKVVGECGWIQEHGKCPMERP